MKLEEISKKTLIIFVLLIIFLLFIYFYYNKQENYTSSQDYLKQTFKTYNNKFPSRSIYVLNIDTEETRNKMINSDIFYINFQPNQIIILYDAPNNKLMIFDFDNAIVIYDFINSIKTIYTPKAVDNMANYKLKIMSDIFNNNIYYNFNIQYTKTDGTGTGIGFGFKKTDLFNVNNFDKLLSEKPDLISNKSPFDPTKQLDIIPNMQPTTKNSSNNSNQQEMFPSNSQFMATSATTKITSSNIKYIDPYSRAPFYSCIPQEQINFLNSQINNLDMENAQPPHPEFFRINHDKFKSKIDLLKTFTDEQIICILEKNDPNFCNKLNDELNNNNQLQALQTLTDTIALYKPQLIDLKTIILPRVLTIINKCNNLTKENKLKALNGFKNLLNTLDTLYNIIGNNRDLIRTIENIERSI